jgi:hypothetical protein
VKNKYVIDGDTVRILVESPKYGHKEVLISLTDLARVDGGIPGKICVVFDPGVKDFYVQYHDGNRRQFLHRFLMDFPDGFMIDHINNNTLDNRSCNLRLADNRLNQSNRKQVTSSKYTGVSWNKPTKKWQAYIRIDGKKHHLGYFESEESAYEAYLNALSELKDREACSFK